MTALSIGLTLAMVAAAIALVWTYTAGNAWYASRVGRALVTLSIGILFIEVYSLVRRLLNWPAWTAQVEQGVILVALVLLTVAFARERREEHRRQAARKIHHRGLDKPPVVDPWLNENLEDFDG